MTRALVKPEIAAGGDFRPIYVSPALKPEDWGLLEEKLPELAQPDIGRLQMRGPDHGRGVMRLGMILLPYSVLPEVEEQGPEILRWTGEVANILGRRELRYGRQRKRSAHRPGYFIGVSEELSSAEKQLCDDNELDQQAGSPDRPLYQPIVNRDGSQTFEYVGHPGKSGDFRLAELHKTIMGTLAPGLDRLVSSNVEVALLPNLALPSLFSDLMNDQPNE